MRVTEKTEDLFNQIEAIHRATFQPPFRAPKDVLRDIFNEDEIFVIFSCTGKVGAFALIRAGVCGPHIWEIAVNPVHQRNGWAGILIQEISEYYKNQGYLGLKVCTENVNAQKAYLKNGFKVYGFDRDFYGFGLHGLKMRRKLNE